MLHLVAARQSLNNSSKAGDRCVLALLKRPLRQLLSTSYGEERHYCVTKHNAMSGPRPSMVQFVHKALPLFTGIVAVSLLYGCSTVQVVRLSSEQFSPRRTSEVEILDREPATEHLRLAELVASSSTSSLEHLQRDILKKAAQLGASAVVFSRPTTHIEQRITQAPGYSPWGYYAPYYYGAGAHGYLGYGYGGWPYASLGYGSMYGPWGPGWGYTSVPYIVQVSTLKGLAIRYNGS